ncbi:MAG TPA: c-type cytochrome [Syntrophobacteria bacterium]|nr:c-type cytochrome [Syntrophobacteria bacterium]
MKKILVLFVFVLVAVSGVILLLQYIDNYAAAGRMRETPGMRPHEEPTRPMEAGIVPFSGGEALFRATPADELVSPLQLNDPAVIEMGGKLYGIYCAQCHGPNHDGNGTVGQSFAPLPTDLRSAKVQSLFPGAHFKEISYGIPDGRQPALATTIAVPDRWRIVAFVKSLGRRS